MKISPPVKKEIFAPPVKSDHPLTSDQKKPRDENLYRELVAFMENLFSSFEKNKPLELEQLQTISKKITNAFLDNTDMLAELNKPTPVENYLPYHTVNVCLLSVAIGNKLNYITDRLVELAQMGLLHDIEMIKISKNIFLKQKNLPEIEFKKIDESPIRNLLKNAEIGNPDILDGLHQSHEREDRQDCNPQKYKKGEINNFAEILGIADTYETLTHDRVHRKAMNPYRAMKEIVREVGHSLYPSLLKVLIEVITFYPLGSYVQLSRGEICIVKKTSSEFPVRPVVQIIWDKDKQKLEIYREIDLLTQPFLSIKKILKKETVDKLPHQFIFE